MEQAKSPSKVRFVFVWSVLWGGLTALAITLFNWYTTHRIETGYQVAGRFAIFTASGIVLGLFMWNRRQALDNRTRRNGRLPTHPNGNFLMQGFEVETDVIGDKIVFMQELFAGNDAN